MDLWWACSADRGVREVWLLLELDSGQLWLDSGENRWHEAQRQVSAAPLPTPPAVKYCKISSVCRIPQDAPRAWSCWKPELPVGAVSLGHLCCWQSMSFAWLILEVVWAQVEESGGDDQRKEASQAGGWAQRLQEWELVSADHEVRLKPACRPLLCPVEDLGCWICIFWASFCLSNVDWPVIFSTSALNHCHQQCHEESYEGHVRTGIGLIMHCYCNTAAYTNVSSCGSVVFEVCTYIYSFRYISFQRT